MEELVVGSFREWETAKMALERLHAAGFHHEELSVLSVQPEGQGGRHPNMATKAPEGALGGAAIGGAIGAVEGFALAAILIPGIGPFLAAGPILAGLAGLAAGAGAGGLLGTIMGAGFTRDDAVAAEQGLGRGEILLAVPARGREAEARSIMEAAGGRRVHSEEVPDNMRNDEFADDDALEMERLDRRAAEITAAADPSPQSGNISPIELPLGTSRTATGAVVPSQYGDPGPTDAGAPISASTSVTTPDSAAHNQQRATTGTQVGAAAAQVPGVTGSHPSDPLLDDEDEEPAPAEGMTGLRNVIR